MSAPLSAEKPVTAHPSGDPRFAKLDAYMKKVQYQQDALIEVLHKAQGLFGHLQSDLLLYIAHHLKLAPSRVYGVATFYHLFSLQPPGEHTCVVCMGTACYTKRAVALLGAVEQCTSIPAGAVTPDGKLSLLTARCLGPCGMGPVVVYDGSVAGHQTEASVLTRVKEWLGHGAG